MRWRKRSSPTTAAAGCSFARAARPVPFWISISARSSSLRPTASGGRSGRQSLRGCIFSAISPRTLLRFEAPEDNKIGIERACRGADPGSKWSPPSFPARARWVVRLAAGRSSPSRQSASCVPPRPSALRPNRPVRPIRRHLAQVTPIFGVESTPGQLQTLRGMVAIRGNPIHQT